MVKLIPQVRAYLKLTKPTIMLLVVVTGAAGLVVEGSLLGRPLAFLLVLFGLFCSGGSANALNQYFERDIDAQMSRTRSRRPLPMKQVRPGSALAFAIGIGIIGVVIFAVLFNWLSALLSLGTILFYGLFYTLWLKPNTVHNIVIGGAAGAMGPVIAWAAAANTVGIAAWLMFLIIFLWTPPHFWALALYLQDDYRKVKLPMMPVIRGDLATLRQMWFYTLAMVFVTLVLGAFGTGWLYLVSAVLLGIFFMRKAFSALKCRTRQAEFSLFKFSIIYLLALFFVVILEGLFGFPLVTL